jgi:hypothetical protein
MSKTIIDIHGNISTPEGDTFTMKIDLTKNDPEPFVAADKILIEIRDVNLHDELVSKLVDIEDDSTPEEAKGTGYFIMDSATALKIPPGDYVWSYSVYLNARALDNGTVEGDVKSTPFRTFDGEAWRRYHVEGGTYGGGGY